MAVANSPPSGPISSPQSPISNFKPSDWEGEISPQFPTRNFEPSDSPQGNYNAWSSKPRDLQEFGPEKALEMLKWATEDNAQLGKDTEGTAYTLTNVIDWAKTDLPEAPESGDDVWGEVRTFVTSISTNAQGEKIAKEEGDHAAGLSNKDIKGEEPSPPSSSPSESSTESEKKETPVRSPSPSESSKESKKEETPVRSPSPSESSKESKKEETPVQALSASLQYLEPLPTPDNKDEVTSATKNELDLLAAPSQQAHASNGSSSSSSAPQASASEEAKDPEKPEQQEDSKLEQKDKTEKGGGTPEASSWTPRLSLMFLGLITLGTLAYWQKDNIVNWWQGRKVDQF